MNLIDDNSGAWEDEFYMRRALQEARAALDEDEIPIGAVIVCNGRIVATAHNSTERLNDTTAHAEMLALTMAADTLGSKYLPGCTLYVTVEPCPMCAAATAWAQIGRVVYGAPDAKRGFSLFSPSLLHPKTVLLDGVLQEECAALMKQFFRNKRKTQSL